MGGVPRSAWVAGAAVDGRQGGNCGRPTLFDQPDFGSVYRSCGVQRGAATTWRLPANDTESDFYDVSEVHLGRMDVRFRLSEHQQWRSSRAPVAAVAVRSLLAGRPDD